MAKKCPICGGTLMLLNTSEYSVGDGEKICLDCRGEILEISGVQDPDKKEKAMKAKFGANFDKDKSAMFDIVNAASKIKSGHSVKDAIMGMDTNVSNLFKSKTAEEWRKILKK